MEELNVDTVFTIPIFGGIAIDEAVVSDLDHRANLALLFHHFCSKFEGGKSRKKQLALEASSGMV